MGLNLGITLPPQTLAYSDIRYQSPSPQERADLDVRFKAHMAAHCPEVRMTPAALFLTNGQIEFDVRCDYDEAATGYDEKLYQAIFGFIITEFNSSSLKLETYFCP